MVFYKALYWVLWCFIRFYRVLEGFSGVSTGFIGFL